MRRFCLFFPVLFLDLFPLAAQPTTTSTSDILMGLKKLNTIGSVLYIAAHPDDENTRLLAYFAKERKVRTGYLSLTRGDGGQNLIGKEQGDPLGLIRTQELLAARRIDGAEQFFTRANDFGYSKTPEETFSIWNKDSVLADVVWTIRNFKPDVIICRFPTTGEGGHGHHTASAILAGEAFDAAADPSRFPEQLAFTQTWKTPRLFWNTFNFGGNNTTSPEQLKMVLDVYNPLLGKGYGEIAAESRSMHKSQGFGSARTRGNSLEYFKFLKGQPAQNDVLEGIDLSWNRLPNSSKIQKELDICQRAFDPQAPEKIVPVLISLYKQLQQLNEQDLYIAYWKKLKLAQTEELLLACSGLWLETTASEYSAVPGFPVNVTSQIVKRNKLNVKLLRLRYLGLSDTSLALPLATNELYTYKHRETLPMEWPYSNPYWLNQKHGVGLFQVKGRTWIGKPENGPAGKVIFDLEIEGLPLSVERGICYKSTDPVKGEVYRPWEVLPPATVNISEKVFVFSENLPRKIQFTVKSYAPDLKANLTVNVPEGWDISYSNSEFSLPAKGEEVKIEATLSPSPRAKDGTLSALLTVRGIQYTSSIRRIEYDHIPYQFILTDAEAGLVRVDVKKAGTVIGYIPGAGDDVPACLTQIGYDVHVLSDEQLATENLARYHAILTGVRAYNTVTTLQGHYAKLMEYVNNGGNLVVQYNTNNRIGPVIAKIGPYPFTISRERTTDEKAEVKFLNPTHSALQFPNFITARDFDGWIQERGIYFATEIDGKYEKLLSMQDPGEKPLEGSLIAAKYGKGNFVYTGLAFFRELPAGVPGAYRLLVNLLSLPPNK